MDAGVVTEFGVERGGHGSSLPDRYRVVAFGGDDFDAGAEALDFRGANEDHLKWRVAELAGADGAVDLAAIGVAADADVEGAQATLLGVGDFLRQHDGTGTGAECRLHADKFLELGDARFAEDFQERPRLAAGDDEAVDFVELLRLADEDNLGAEFFEALLVGVEIALDCEN